MAKEELRAMVCEMLADGFSQHELAKITNVPQSNIYRIKAGHDVLYSCGKKVADFYQSWKNKTLVGQD